MNLASRDGGGNRPDWQDERLSRFSIGGRLTVPSLPFDVGHLKQGNIIF